MSHQHSPKYVRIAEAASWAKEYGSAATAMLPLLSNDKSHVDAFKSKVDAILYVPAVGEDVGVPALPDVWV